MSVLGAIFLSGAMVGAPGAPPSPMPAPIENRLFLLPRTPRPASTPEDNKTARQKRRGKNATVFYWDGPAYI